MAETVIALPILGLVVGCIIQLGLLFEAKATLNHATLQAARTAMVSRANPDDIQEGLALGLLPLYSPGPEVGESEKALVCYARPDVAINSCIRIINPTVDAMSDFAFRDKDFGIALELPFDYLQHKSTALGTRSGVNIQDANLLKLRVVYGARLNVPIVGPLISSGLRLLGEFDEFERRLLAENRLPLVASATVRMQSKATIDSPIAPNRFMLSRNAVEAGNFCGQGSFQDFITREQARCLASAAISVGPDDAVACGRCAATLGRARGACARCAITAPQVLQCLFTPSVPQFCES